MSEKRIVELDGVRGLACFGVLISHCFLGVMYMPAGSIQNMIWNNSMYFWLGGVDLFFVLSGFLIGGILIDNKNSENYFAAFWVRRAGRILPVLYLLIASYVVIISLHDFFKISFLDIWLLKSPIHSPLWYATFTQSFPIATSGWGPRWMGITWSLAIEEQFYVIFPLLVYFLSGRSLKATVIGGFVFALICRILVYHNYGWDAAYVLGPCRMDALLSGVAVAMIIRSPQALNLAIRYRLVIDCIIVILALTIANMGTAALSGFLMPYSKFLGNAAHILLYTKMAVFFALCILRIFLYRPVGIYHRILTWKPLTGLGAISYGLYMYHQSINGLVHGMLFGQEPRVDSLAQGVAALFVMAAAIGVATISYLYVELPIRRFAQRVKFEKPSAAVPAQATANY